MARAVSSGTCPSLGRATNCLSGEEAPRSDNTKARSSTQNRCNRRSSPAKKNTTLLRVMLISILIASTGDWRSGEPSGERELRNSNCTIPDEELRLFNGCKRSPTANGKRSESSRTARKYGGENWSRDDLHRSSGPPRHDNCSKDSRPLPKEQIVRQGMHPNPGPNREHQSRGQREAVLGREVGIEDAYTRRTPESR